MNKLNFKWRIKITTYLMWLLVIGLDAAAALIAVNRNLPVVLIPFAIATLVSFAVGWWAQRCDGDLPRHLAQKKSRRIALTPVRQNR